MYRQEGSFGSYARYANEDGPHCGQSGVPSPDRLPDCLGGRTLTARLPNYPPTVLLITYLGSIQSLEPSQASRDASASAVICRAPHRPHLMLHEVCVSSIDRGGALPGGPNYKNSYSSNTAMLCIVRHTAIATTKKSLAVRPAISDILCHGETRITIRWNRARLDEERS